ncbi:J domain-containing protein [Psychromicrobium xiongbiense]|uniref:J domain-containing protein n=1 Tax=Psychromicrobium xiongbiense TaxID=3051184 RepID=UPI002552E548|nr:DnaJ domain-containing protein [Psychromicrobium sp. YIM S02556]
MSALNITHYEVLGLAVTASEQEIKAAYRKAARATHPDHGGRAEDFRRVTEAYRVLGDPLLRAGYDAAYARPQAQNRREGAGNGAFRTDPWDAGSEAGYGEAEDAENRHPEASAFTRGQAKSREATGLPIFVPPFGADQAPLLPLELAARQIHGAPRKQRRSLFGAQARLVREARTIELLQGQILARYPASRLVNGLVSPVEAGGIDHVVLQGYRMAVVGSLMVPEGAYRWTGRELVHGGRPLLPPSILPAAHALGRLFPECTVSAWLVVLSPGNNPFEPVIDYPTGATPDGGAGLSVVGAARLGRQLGSFLAAGTSPQVVDLRILARLLGAMY